MERLGQIDGQDTAAGPATKDADYYSHCRADLLAHVPRAAGTRMLEVGAGRGDTLLQAKRSGIAGYVVGVDVVAMPDSNQGSPEIDRFVVGDVESIDLGLPAAFFDVILCGDVLEHLVDPWRTVARLMTLLRDGGVIVASVPNVRYWKVSLGLAMAGRWRYGEAGILDRTHLRFFVRETVPQLFSGAGLSIERVDAIGPQRQWGLAGWLINTLSFGLLTDLLAVQYIVVARKPGRCRER